VGPTEGGGGVKASPIPEWVIWGGALEMAKQHGEDAGTWAAMRADELLAKGDIDGHRTWCRIVARLEELLTVERTLN
jgi:hypothetical protein